MSATHTSETRFVIPSEAAFTATGPLGCPINPDGVAPLWSACREVARSLRARFTARRRRGH